MVVSAKATGRDTSQAEMAREVLQQSEQKYQQTMTDVPQHIGDFDENVPLNFIIENTHPLGNWLLQNWSGDESPKAYGNAATAGAEGFRAFLIFMKGEPEGGIYIDRSGVLYGDRSVLFLKNSQNFTFYPTEPDMIANRFVTGCRIYDKSHLRVPASNPIPEISSYQRKRDWKYHHQPGKEAECL